MSYKDGALIKIKRTVFWLQVASTVFLMVAGFFLSGILFFSGGADALQGFLAMLEFSGWLIGAAIQSFAKVPELSIPAFVSALMFVVSMYYFAQTETEQRAVGYAAAAFPFAILLCAIGILGAVLSGMPGQGAGH